jgi:Xaa-Pro aminopeptidase
MRYQPLSAKTYVNHRRKLTDRMSDREMAIVSSNDILPTNSDGNMPFRQNSNLLYLSGVDQEESILVIFPSAHTKAHREILFLKETSPEIAIWEGEKLSKTQAQDLTGIKSIMWVHSFETVLKTLMSEAETVLLPSNEHTRRSIETETREERFSKWIREEYSLHTYGRLSPHMHRIRSIKSVEEIEQMQRACKITEDGFRRILKFTKPGVKEYEIQAEFMHEFLRQQSRGFAYEPIIASGFSACVLHYISNENECKDGEVILMDVACEYGNYASDMTRAIPVNGKFTSRQKDVYNAVLHVMKEAKELLKPGIFLADYHKKVGGLMEEQLIKLGLLTKEEVDQQNPSMPAYKKYFMHGTSHFIGLDVHDVGLWTEPIEAGMAFTVEPGIYIREENLGIRLENDIIITEDGFIDLMKDIPIEVNEIEELMKA